MGRRLEKDTRGFAKTHPDPKDRVKDINRQIGTPSPIASEPARQARFDKALAGI
jgi:hypothetical protein